jgi:hypothetical protein
VDDVISRWWLLAAIISGIGKGKEKRSAEGGIGSGAWDRGSKRGQIKSDHNKKTTTRKESGIKSSKKKPREHKEHAIEGRSAREWLEQPEANEDREDLVKTTEREEEI